MYGSYDPFQVARQRMYPRPRTVLLTTRGWGRSSPVHTHRGEFDSDGNGLTDIIAGHFHRIIGGKIMPSPVDSHDHEFTQARAGIR